MIFTNYDGDYSIHLLSGKLFLQGKNARTHLIRKKRASQYATCLDLIALSLVWANFKTIYWKYIFSLNSFLNETKFIWKKYLPRLATSAWLNFKNTLLCFYIHYLRVGTSETLVSIATKSTSRGCEQCQHSDAGHSSLPLQCAQGDPWLLYSSKYWRICIACQQNVSGFKCCSSPGLLLRLILC